MPIPSAAAVRARIRKALDDRPDNERWPDTTDPNRIYHNVMWMMDNGIEVGRTRAYIRRCLRLARQMGRKEGTRNTIRLLNEQGAAPRLAIAVVDEPSAEVEP